MLQTHEDAAIHSASEWLLETWGYGDAVDGVKGPGANGQLSAGNWSITADGHTMVTVDGREEPGVGRKFAIATKEVTVAQFQRLFPEYRPYSERSPTADCPANVVSWYDAVAYCRRLSEVAGVPEDQMCFPPPDKMHEEIKPYPDYLSRSGYRLPTQSEWQLACRADSNTNFFFGESHELLSKYAWFAANSGYRLSPVGAKKPNDLGLFDMYGNAMEWCDDMVGTDRALRGGSANFRAESMSSWRNEAYAPTTRYYSNGFRVARTYISASEGKAEARMPD
jgi:formylglycine-generating enzyme required for sulfatase activity